MRSASAVSCGIIAGLMPLRARASLGFAGLLVASCVTEIEVFGDSPYTCIEETTVLDGLDAMSSVGFTPADVLALAGGPHSVTMRWAGPFADGSTRVVFGPESGEAELTVDIQYEGGEIHHIASTTMYPHPTPEAYCRDRIEITVTATVHTGGGALAETVVAPLSAATPNLATLDVSIPFTELKGSLAATELQPDGAELQPLELSIGVSPAGLFGTATTTVAVRDGNSVGVGFLDVARWPADSRCQPGEVPLGLDDALDGFTAAEALAVVGDAGALSLTWEGGPATAMSLALNHDGAPACAVYEGEMSGSMRLFADAAITTDDGRWDGSLPVEVVATPTLDKALASVDIRTADLFATVVPPAEFVATFGLEGIDLGTYASIGVDLRGSFTRETDTVTAAGEVEVVGLEQNPCPDPEAGCMGTDVVTLAAATWTTP